MSTAMSSAVTARHAASRSNVPASAYSSSAFERVPSNCPSTTTTCSRAGSALRASRDPLDEGRLGDRHAGRGVTEQVLDLLGRGRVVDRERRGAEVQDRSIDDERLRPVGQHHRHRGPPPDPERTQRGGDPAHADGVLTRRDLALPAMERRAGRSGNLAAIAWHASHSVRGAVGVVGHGELLVCVRRAGVENGLRALRLAQEPMGGVCRFANGLLTAGHGF